MEINMGIIKLEVSLAEASRVVDQFRTSRVRAWEAFSIGVRDAVGDTINRLLRAEMTLFLGTPEGHGNKLFWTQRLRESHPGPPF